MTGDAQAMARVQEMSQIVGRNPALGLLATANPADIAAAMRGDPAAIARLKQMEQLHQAGQPKRTSRGKCRALRRFILSWQKGRSAWRRWAHI